MYDLHPFFAVVAALGLAASSWPALGLQPKSRLAVLAVLAVGVGSTPWLVPRTEPVVRFLVSIYAGALVLKLWDLHIGALRSSRPEPKAFLAFLANLPSLVHRRTGVEAQPTASVNLRRFVGATALFLMGVGSLFSLLDVDWTGTPFFVEHLAKSVAFFIATCAAFTAVAAGVRSVGGYAPEPVDRPWVARTPGDFWRRYNRWIGEGMREDVFRPLGGLRSPRRATLGVFFLSGVLHEYVFAAAVGGVQGYQLGFFMLQGVAVALTLGAKPPALLGAVATHAFNAVTSVLFFASIHQMVPFYQRGLPGWLGGG